VSREVRRARKVSILNDLRDACVPKVVRTERFDPVWWEHLRGGFLELVAIVVRCEDDSGLGSTESSAVVASTVSGTLRSNRALSMSAVMKSVREPRVYP
jgi:hypothetical protein